MGYRDQIERELAKRLQNAALKGPRHEDGNARLKPSRDEDRADTDDVSAPASAERRAKAFAERDDDSSATVSSDRLARTCGECGTANDMDARYCKGCGQVLAGR